MTSLERQYGDYAVTDECFQGNHDACAQRWCQCPHHPPTIRERTRVVRARISRQLSRRT